MKNEALHTMLEETFSAIGVGLKSHKAELGVMELGVVTSVGRGVATIEGLSGLQAEELVLFAGGVYGIAFTLDAKEVGVIMLGEGEAIGAGSEVRRTGSVVGVPVGDALLGRVVDALGHPLDEHGPIKSNTFRPIERDAPSIIDRAPVTVPLQTGLKVVDALIPIGRGQRELILGDRQTGKTAVALDTIINQKGRGVICVYCSIGQRSSAVAKFIDDLRKYQATEYSIVIAASGESTPAMKFIVPYAATTMAEYFMERGEDVLIVYDDLTQHARAYRELSLLLGNPPGREAYPGDIFYIHSRLLERATHLREELGGGSLTALPIVEVEGQNVAAYIPTNLISITDGQIYLSPELQQKGILPAVDAGKSVSRVGGKTQLPSYRAVAGDLKLSYAQFEELEKFARFSIRLDDQTRKTIERGRRIREILKQSQYDPMPASEQVAILLAVNDGIFDDIPLEDIREAEEAIRKNLRVHCGDILASIDSGEKLGDENQMLLVTIARQAVKVEEEIA
ncbi:MAG: alternate F1F0 ATPase, F1 subunit alpha [Geobacteraceae bacterium]|nr:alternate F1F0 ATPase, F1 subunit alpha [Geobacteraceae bacterium]